MEPFSPTPGFSARLLRAVIPCLWAFLSAAAAADTLRLATGGEEGVYYAIGKGITAALGNEIPVEVLKSNGSIENLRWLDSGKADLGIAQSDAVRDAYLGLGEFTGRPARVRAIASLYTEAVHVVVRGNLYLRRAEDMRGKRISVGPEGSGTESNALAILDAAGLGPDEVRLVHMGPEESVRALREKTLDIAIVTSGIPSPIVQRMLEGDAARLFDFHTRTLERLTGTEPCLVGVTIRKNAYAHQPRSVRTVGVPALLVARGTLPNPLVYAVARALFARASLIAAYHPEGGQIELKTALDGVLDSSLSRGARAYYEDEGISWLRLAGKIGNWIIILSLGALLLAILAYLLRNSDLGKKKLSRILALLVAVMVLDVLLLYLFEHDINEDYANAVRAFWPTLVNLISFGAREPVSGAGRITSTAASVLWAAGLTWLTGQMVASFVAHEIGRIKTMHDHYVIINWNSKADGIIRQLESPDLEPRDITVISDSDEAGHIMEAKKGLKERRFRRLMGDPTDETILDGADIQKAHSIIILARENPGDKNGDITDARTILILLKILKACNKKEITVIVEIIEPNHVETARGLDSTSRGKVVVEVVSTKEMGAKLLSQAIVSPGMHALYRDLLTFDQSDKGVSREIYRAEIPEQLKDATFAELVNHALRSEFNLLPIAVADPWGNPVISPDKDQREFLLSKSKYYFAIASREKDLKDFARNPKKNA